MARIALVLGMALAGIAISVATGGLGTFAVGAWGADIFAGAAAGLTAGSILAQMIFPPKSNSYPPLNDLQVMSSAPGNPIPWGYGTYRIAGNVIWATQITVHKYKQQQGGGKGGMMGGPSQTAYFYTVDVAISFGYGPGKITRIWADSKLIYDLTGKGPIAIDTGLVMKSGRQQTEPFTPIIYPGTSTQNPNPTIQAKQGINSTPAFRDQVYMLLKDFPLADYGNRCPSFRAEISTGTTLSYIKDMFGPQTDPGFYSGGVNPSSHCYIDSLNRVGYVIDSFGETIQKIDLEENTGTPLATWQPLTAYNFGDEVLDSNGNVQHANASFTTHSTPPTWQTGEGAVTVHSPENWTNLGPGPNAVLIVRHGQLQLTGAGGTSQSQNLPDAFSVDTAGNLWGGGVLQDGSFNLFKYDSQTFRNLAKITVPSVPLDYRSVLGVLPVKSSVTGKNYLYFTTQQFQGLFVVDADANKLVATGSWALPTQSAFDNSDGSESMPCVDPSTGVAYILAKTSGPNTTYINICDPRSGSIAITKTLTLSNSWQNNGSETGQALFWCEADKTLIMWTTVGSARGHLVKIDPNTGAILAVLHDVVQPGSGIGSMYAKGYSGLIPADGILKVSNGQSPRGIVYVDGVEMTIIQTVAMTNWVPALGATDQLNSFSYDPLSNSALCCFGGPYAGLSTRIYFDRTAVGGQELDLVLADVWAKTGADPTLFDASQVTGMTVRGYPITQMLTAKGIMTPLCAAYFFDVVETNNKLTAVPRGGAVSTVIPENDLGIVADGAEAQLTIVQQHDLPLVVTVDYYDPTLDYQQAKQMFKRNKKVKKTRNQTQLQLPLVLQADEAAQISARALATVWAERNQWEFKLWKALYLINDPTDIVQFTYRGNIYEARLVKASVGQDKVLALNFVSEDPRQYSALAPAGIVDTGFQGSTIKPLGPTLLFALDCPFITDNDMEATAVTGFYWLMGSPLPGQWPGAVLFLSSDNNTFLQNGNATDPVFYGTVVDATPAPATLFSWDAVTTISVLMASGTLSSDTLLNVLNGSNWFILNGEIMAFATAVLNADGSYTLSNLLRGLRGTESWCSTHGVGETLIMLQNYQRTTEPSSFLNVAQYLRGVTIGLPVSGVPSQVFMDTGNDVKPYAVAELAGTVDGSFNINMTWIRRTRAGGEWIDGIEVVPLSEQSESYDLYIYSGSTLKRTVLGLTAPLYQYLAADQVTDFGSHQASVKVTVYQNSATCGHGFATTNSTVGLGNVVTG